MRPIRPLRGHLLVQQDKPKEKVGAIFVPQGSEEWPPLATVVRLGQPALDKSGNEISFAVVVGDRVLFKRRAATALSPDVRESAEWQDLIVLVEDDIVGVVTEES